MTGSTENRISGSPLQRKFRAVVSGQEREICLELASSRDAPELVSFHNAYYGTKRKPESWTWEYAQFEPEKSVFLCARDGNEVVATGGVMPIYLEIGNERILTGKTENLLCLPAYRRTSVFLNGVACVFENCKNRGIRFIWGFSSRRRFTKLDTYLGRMDVLLRQGNAWVDMYWRLKGDRPLYRRFGAVVKLFLQKIFRLGRKKTPDMASQAGYNVVKDGRIEEHDLRDLYSRIRNVNKNMICLVLDDRYLAWRVRRHPFLKYHEYQVRKDDTLVAYAFVTLFRGTATITDILSEDEHATTLMLDAIVRDYESRAGRFRCMGNPKDYVMKNIFARLCDFGFAVDEKTSEQWHFTMNSLGLEIDDRFLDIRNWHITGLWTEGYLY